MAAYDNIKALCTANHITLRQLEREIGLSDGVTSKWRKVNPSADALIKIADYFGVSTDKLLGRSDYELKGDRGHDVLIEYVSNMSKSNRDALLKYAKFLAEECNNVG